MAASVLPTASPIFHPNTPLKADKFSTQARAAEKENRWIFGLDIPTTRLNIGPGPERESYDGGPGARSVVYRETILHPVPGVGPGEEGGEQIVSTTRRRK